MRRISGIVLLCVLLSLIVLPAQASESGACGQNITWRFENGEMTLSGTGAMTDFSNTSRIPWYDFRDQITSVILEDGITTVGALSFVHCTNLSSVRLPDSLTSVGRNAFWGCRSLAQAELPEGLTGLGSGAFFQCVSLTQISIPAGITVVEQAVFAQCERLDTVALHDGITVIGKEAFSRCYALKHITLPIALQRIETHAFFGCVQLQQLTFPESVAGIADAAFYGCVNLKYLHFMGSAPKLGEKAFLDISAEIRYPMRNNSWDSVTEDDYGGNITWKETCNHSYEITFTPPGCETKGFSTYTCGLCGDTYYDLYIPSLGHIPGEAVKENEGQELVIYCSVCGKELSREAVAVHIPGDINGDGNVDNKDLTRLFRYLSGYDVEVVEAALDVNGDGSVNNKDQTRLFRYLSGWDVLIC